MPADLPSQDERIPPPPGGPDVPPPPPPPPSSRRIGGREIAIASMATLCLVSVVVATLRLPPPDALPNTSGASVVAVLDSTDSLNAQRASDSSRVAGGVSRPVAAAAGVAAAAVAVGAGVAAISPKPAATPVKPPNVTPVAGAPAVPIRKGAAADTTPIVATIVVSSMPASAELRVDGNVRSGRRLKVEPGRHILTVAFDGHIARTDTLTLARAETRNWTPRVSAPAPKPADAKGSAKATDVPRTASAKIENSSRGKAAKVSECDANVASQSWSNAVQACTKDAGDGSASAKRQLALLYQQGKGIGRNDDLAAQWFGSAANGGDAEGMYQYAVCLEKGRGVKKDQTQAMRWYTKGAEQGNAAAQYAAGDAFDRGKLGVKKDKAQALHWFQQAAAQNFRDAADKVRNLSK